MRRRTAALALVVPGLVSAGCGRERIAPPDTIRPATPSGVIEQPFPQAGVIFEAPTNWPFITGKAPLVATATSGSATVAVWRYLRSEPLPSDEAELASAQAALEDAARTRDGSFVVQEGRRLEIDGAPAVQLLGTESVAGQKRRVRSTHVYAKGAEIVLDAYTTEREFARVDREVFTPMVESLKVDPPRG